MSRNDGQNVNVTSYNQSGGVTAHTVNLGTPRRSLDPVLEADLLTFPRSKPIRVMAIMDAEACEFAYQIHGFLKSNGFPMKEPGGITRMLSWKPGIEKLAFHNYDDKDEAQLIVGPNS